MAAVSHDEKWRLGSYALGSYGSPQVPLLRYSSHHLLQQSNSVLLSGGCLPNASCELPSASSVADGDYRVTAHEMIASSQNLYEVLELLGRGTFGQVLRCWKKESNEIVAVKILKNLPSYTKQGQVEVDVLSTLSKVNSEAFNFVHAYESFTHHGHICIVFECLRINLYDYLKQTRFQPLPLKHIRPVAQQVLMCLKKLRELGLVHADLKPENIMLVDPDCQPFRVKVIDFGSATCPSSHLSSTYLQSRYYRAPEVILGAPYDEAIDIWSLGCVLAELFLGWPLLPGATEYDQITYISQMLGQPPPTLTRNTSKMSKFYRRDNHRKWVLKPQSQVQKETGATHKEARKFVFTSVSAIGQVSTSSHQASNSSQETLVAWHQDKLQFIAMLEMLLTFDPRKRADPSSCLQHPFVTMLHLATQTATPCVQEWIECMQVCCRPRTVPPATSFSAFPSLLSAYLPAHTYPSVVPLPSPWVSTDYHTPMVVQSSVDTGYVSADPSPTITLHSMECPKVEMIAQTRSPFLFAPHTPPYWLMLRQSGYLANHSRL